MLLGVVNRKPCVAQASNRGAYPFGAQRLSTARRNPTGAETKQGLQVAYAPAFCLQRNRNVEVAAKGAGG